MPTLQITKLECIKKRDPVGKSEFDIYVSVDSGTEFFLSGPHMMDNSKNDDEVKLQDAQPFTDTIRIRLKERNGDRGGNNDLDLGVRWVHADERQNTTYTYPFTSDNGGVDVNVSYRVTA
jgi:hypothetical protein